MPERTTNYEALTEQKHTSAYVIIAYKWQHWHNLLYTYHSQNSGDIYDGIPNLFTLTLRRNHSTIIMSFVKIKNLIYNVRLRYNRCDDRSQRRSNRVFNTCDWWLYIKLHEPTAIRDRTYIHVLIFAMIVIIQPAALHCSMGADLCSTLETPYYHRKNWKCHMPKRAFWVICVR